MTKYSTVFRARWLRAAIAAGILTSGAAEIAGAQALVVPPTNPAAVVQQRVGLTDIEVRFNRPAVKGREIFGALVPFDQVWRTGSDSSTKISFNTAVRFSGTDVEAGTYELFTIPGRQTWFVMLQPNRTQWGSYAYDPEKDVARVPVQARSAGESLESFTIGFRNVGRNSATLEIGWDRTRVPVRIEIDVVAQVVPRIEDAMKADGRKPYFLAAMFYFENDLDLAKAAEWMAAAIAEQPGHIGMLHRLALILEKKGDYKGALAAAQQSLAGAQKAARELRDEYTRLNTPLIERLKAKVRVEPGGQ